MAKLRRFLERFQGSSDGETQWLQELFEFVRAHLCHDPAPSDDLRQPLALELSLGLVRILQETSASRSLPVSYRLVSLSDLVSLQRLPCVSRLSWTTNQHRVWAREAEQIPGLRPLPRVKLLLIGRLCRGRGPDLSLKDATGELTCQVPVWSQDLDQDLDRGLDWDLDQDLDRAVFLPHWNYIPQDAPGRGLLELIGSPLPLCPAPRQGLASTVEGAGSLSVNQAASLLLQHQSRMRCRGDGGRGGRCHGDGRRVSVRGVVSAVCPLLDIGGTTFFIFSLAQNKTNVNVIVKDSSCRLWWSRSVHVGMSVHLTQLRACTLRNWNGNSVLSATGQSELTIHQPHQSQPSVHPTDQSQPSVHPTDQSQPSVHPTDQSQRGSEETQTLDQSEAEVLSRDQSGLRRSSVINYKGTVTEVLSRGAGLYVIDRKVGLCLANQPLPTRPIRPGDTLQISNVHMLRRPSPDYSPIMLCCCLRSSVTVTAFSPGYCGDEEESCPGDGVLPRLLLLKDVGVAEYLWMCHVTTRLRDSLGPQREQCLCLLSWRILESVTGPRTSRRRHIYAEMMDTPHTCTVTKVTTTCAVAKYGSASSLPHMLSVSSLCSSLLSLCWSSLSLCSLLPPDGQSLNCSQLNAALSWSQVRLGSDPRDPRLDSRPDSRPDQRSEQRPPADLNMGERPLLLVGILQLPSPGSEAQSLELRDSTGTVPCVVTEAEPDQGLDPDQDPDQDPRREQTAAFSTAWIGCLVCVRHFTMITERFIQSEFPSFKYLDQEHFISRKDARIYLQFSLDQVTVLSPSVSMAIQLGQGAGPGHDASGEEAESEERRRKRRKTDEEGGATACVSVVIRVEQKEGVSLMNVGAGSTLSFNLKAAVIGPVVCWGRDPKNHPITEREVTARENKSLSLCFSGPSTRWFPLLQDGRYYRLLAPDTQDPSVLIGRAVTGQTGVELHADAALHVRSDWKIHTVPRPQTTAPESCDLSSLSDVITSRSDLVSFRGLVLERVGVTNRSQESAHTGVRLTVCDLSGRSLQVYLERSHAPISLGLLPGNTLSFSRVQRKVSRSGAVYCCCVPVSCVSVLSTGHSSTPAPPRFPIMLLGQWSEGAGVSVARVKGHLVCVLFLELQWTCSKCDRVYTTSCSGPQCSSSSSVFRTKLKAVLEDGSAEAHVCFYDPLVQTLLRLDDSQWAGLQRALRVRGHIQVQPRGRSLSVVQSGPVRSVDLDPVWSFLLSSARDALIGSLSLTCRRQHSLRATELRRLGRGDRDFVTKVSPPLQLTCVHLERT